jgi:hypothetical protein
MRAFAGHYINYIYINWFDSFKVHMFIKRKTDSTDRAFFYVFFRHSKHINLKQRNFEYNECANYDNQELQNEIMSSEHINNNIDDRAFLLSKGILYYIKYRDSHIILPSDYRHFGVFDEIKMGYYIKYKYNIPDNSNLANVTDNLEVTNSDVQTINNNSEVEKVIIRKRRVINY